MFDPVIYFWKYLFSCIRQLTENFIISTESTKFRWLDRPHSANRNKQKERT